MRFPQEMANILMTILLGSACILLICLHLPFCCQKFWFSTFVHKSLPRWAESRINICPIFIEAQHAWAIRQKLFFPPPFHQLFYTTWLQKNSPQDRGGAVTCRSSQAKQTSGERIFLASGRHCPITINRPGASKEPARWRNNNLGFINTYFSPHLSRLLLVISLTF